jgi:hypothetical protein
MLELYAFISLAGLGYLLSRSEKTKDQTSFPVDVNDLPSQNNTYDASYYEAVQRLEALKAQKKFTDSKSPQVTGVINRQYRDQRDFQDRNKTVKSNLAGIEIPENEFMHNNMTPYFGSRIKQNTEPVANRSVLEKFTGEFGADIWQKKKEQKPIFDPMRKDVGNVFGNENRTDYYIERIFEPRARKNERPFESIHVGPGLNKGYSSTPVGGFQQFEIQDYVKPKNVDELRLGSNPKETYEGRVLPGSGMAQRGSVGEVVKNRATTFYENGPNRYFTTVGAYTKETERPEYEVKDTNRTDTTKEYAGDPHVSTAPKMEGAVKVPARQQLEDFGFRNVDGDNYGKGEDYDFGKKNILVAENERDLTSTKTYEGNITSLVKSIIAPLEDIFRTSRKEYTVQNPRLYGQFQATFPAKITIKDPNDVLRTTIKETSIHDTVETGNIKGAVKVTVYDPEDIARTTHRQTMKPMDSQLNIQGGSRKGTLPANDEQRTTLRQTLIDGERYGNMNTMERTQGGYKSTEYDAKLTQKQFTTDHDYFGPADKKQEDGYKIAPDTAPDTQRQFLSDNDYYGGAGTVDAKKPVSMEDIMNARVNELKEGTLEGREPTKESVKIAIGSEQVNATTRKLEIDQYAERENSNIDHVYKQQITSAEDIVITKEKDQLENDDRLDINILSSLSSNPYAIKPLSSA